MTLREKYESKSPFAEGIYFGPSFKTLIFFFGVGQRGTKLLKVTFAFFFFFFPCNYTKQQTRDSGQSVVKYLCGASLHNIRLSVFECPVIL